MFKFNVQKLPLITVFALISTLVISCSADKVSINDLQITSEKVIENQNEIEKEIESEKEKEKEKEIEIEKEKEDDTDIVEDEESAEEQACDDKNNFVFNENDGLVYVEFENANFDGAWVLKNDGAGSTGQGYMVWNGSQNLGTPGTGLALFTIKINNPGTYRFSWFSAVKTGNSGSDHNDTWLRFNDADNYYAKKDNSVVYPRDTGKTPNPNGASKDGWFKIYRSGNDLGYKWQAATFDHNEHSIYAVFNNAGTYEMEVSARSSGHGIDKFVLFNTNYTKDDAISDENEPSKITCN